MQLFSRKRQQDCAPIDSAGLWAYLLEVPLATLIVTADGTVKATNAAAERLLRLDQQTLQARDLLSAVHVSDRAAHQEQWRRLVSNESGEFRLRERWIRTDGTTVDCQAIGFLVPGETGSQSIGILTLEDVTASIQLETTKRDAELAMANLQAAGDILVAGNSATASLRSHIRPVWRWDVLRSIYRSVTN